MVPDSRGRAYSLVFLSVGFKKPSATKNVGFSLTGDVMTKSTTGLLIAAIFAIPFIGRGVIALATGTFATTPKLGPPTISTGYPAYAAAAGFICLGLAVLAVAGAQWPHLRKASIFAAVVLGAGTLAGFGAYFFLR